MPTNKKKTKTVKTSKKVSNPFSSGGGGNTFETRVQAMVVTLMLTGGFAPCLPTWPISKIKLQGKYTGFDIDDLIIYTQSPNNNKKAKLLGQIKHSIRITQRDKVFGEVIQAAWNDFNNPKVFTEKADVIALITGPLSVTDNSDVRTILEWARNSEDANDFLTKVNQVHFSSHAKREKLKVFQNHLKNANGGIDLSDDELWRFLKSFHLIGYDLNIKAGSTLSLLQSLISQYSPENAQALWTQIIDEVQSANQNAGTMTIDSLPEELQSAFQRRAVETFPTDITRTSSTQEKTDWSKIDYASELAIANLLGSWDDHSDADKTIVEQITGEEHGSWITKIRKILHMPGSPLTLKNGKWNVNNRMDLLQKTGDRLFDEQLDRFKQGAVTVLKEHNPKFELPPEERYAASIHGKISRYSKSLRKGMAESLALLGSYPQELPYCSPNKAENIALVTVREVLEEADWVLWSSLDDVLPLLAEAAPNQFITAVENTLHNTPCPFNEVFAQERTGITGANYMTGLLWALETLAWNDEYITQVAVILGELAVLDPGGNWANRPTDSLKTIFLPWLPQTSAPIEKRKVAIQTLQKEIPDITWQFLLTMLPNQHQISTGAHKPLWRWSLPENQPKVTHQDYWEQVSFYANMAVDEAKNDLTKLTELVKNLHNLPQQAFDSLLEHLTSEEIIGKHEEERLPLWTKLLDFITKHKKYSDSKWALNSDLIEKINKIAEKLAPKNPLNLYKRLFCSPAAKLFDETGNWKEQREILAERRQNAVKDLISSYELNTLIEFAKDVESPFDLGLSLGFIDNEQADSVILPNCLDITANRIVEFTNGFIWARSINKGWAWSDQIDTSKWSISQIGRFLCSLPFTNETWKLSEKLLKDNEAEYWSNISVNPVEAEVNVEKAIDKLMEHNRPNAALSCINNMLYNKQDIDKSRTVKALLAAVSSDESAYTADLYDIIEIIKALQKDPSTNQDELFKVEWAYLSILDRDDGASPKLLEQRLASDPEFFCEVIQLVFLSKNEKKSEKEPDEHQIAIATNAYELIRKWQTPPGLQPDGSFSGDHFNGWLDKVKKICSKSGHLGVGLSHVGTVLIHCPPDPSGLWINSTVAEAINAKDAEDLRRGFSSGILNSRGVHWVDPTGKPEKELAAKYKKQADEAEAQGYQRLASTLREVADSYKREAVRIIEEF